VASGNAVESSNFSLTFSSAGTNRVNDAISLGTGALNKTGAGITILSAGNSYSGGTLVSEGTMIMGHNNAFGTGAVTNGTGAIFSTDSSARSLTNEFVMGGSSALAGTGSLTLSNLTLTTSTGVNNLTNNVAGGLVVDGTVTLGSGTQNRTLVLLGTGDATFNGSIVPSVSGIGTIIAETSGGVVTLNASNSYNGSTIVRSNAVLMIGNAYALGTTDGFTQINGGAQLDLNGQSVAGEELRLNIGDVLDVPRLVNSSSSAVTWSGTVNMANTNAVAVTNGSINFTGNMTGAGAMTKTGSGTLLFTGTSDRTGATTVAAGTLVVGDGATGGSLGSGTVTISDGSAATLRFNRSDTVTLSAVVSGNAAGSLVQAGSGTVALTGSNAFAGHIDVQAGTVQLDTAAGSAAGAVSAISVAGGATLLVSRSNQVSDTASVTLSGGTITRGSGVSEVFGDLNLTGNSTLDFGGGTAGNLTFGVYEENATPSALLTLSNFFGGNTLVFGSDLSSYLAPGTYNTDNFSNSYFTINSISGGFTASVQGSTFTITAIPEPSTVLAASALACLLLGGVLRRGKTRKA
jgi:fibronectin-binding autotransporter adhesin